MNLLTIDVEDWHSLVQRRITGVLPPISPFLSRQVDNILEILSASNTKATFFLVGYVAAQRPDLVKELVAQGHEIASHGYVHKVIYQLTPQAFRDDTYRSKCLLEDITGQAVQGYRAAEFSVLKKTGWALEILAELGFRYDSSIFPIYHRRYGIPDFPLTAQRCRLNNGADIVEIPLSVALVGKHRLPFSGGGYFRLLPLKVIVKQIESLQRRSLPLVTYFHPYEFDDQRLNGFDYMPAKSISGSLKCWRYNLLQNINRKSTIKKLTYLIKNLRFTTCQEFLSKSNIPSSDYFIVNRKYYEKII